jgi:hypothetical protein
MPVASKPAAEGLRERHKAGSVGNSREKGDSNSSNYSKSSESLKVHAQVAAAQVGDVLSLLLLFRFINALCVRTFFQPDEYFQALEPAWSIAFGADSGAWMTWVYYTPSLSPSSYMLCVGMCCYVLGFSYSDGACKLRNGNTSSGHRYTLPSLAWHTRP